MAAAGQSVGDRGGGHPRRLHGDPRYHHRQCEPAPYRGLDVGELRRRDLDAHLLSGGERDRAAHLRLARPAPGPQALFPDLHRRLHPVFLSLRHGDLARPAHRLSPLSGVFRRRAAAQPAIDHPRYVRARPARTRLFGGGDRHHLRPRHRPHARGLDHRQLHLALGVPDQRAGGDLRLFRGGRSRRGSALAQGGKRQAAGDRLYRARSDRAWHRLAADHARPRRGQ